MRLTERKLLILTIIIPGIMAIGLAIYGYFIQYNKLIRIQGEIESVKVQVKEAEAKVVQMIELDKRLDVLRKEKEGIKDLLPVKTDELYEDFLNSMVKIAQEAKLVVHGANVSDEVKKSGPPTGSGGPTFEKISYSLRAEGEFYDCINFIYLLETNKRFIKVDKISLRPTNLMGVEKTGTAIRHLLEVKITSYTYISPNTEKK
ncbi:MAG: GspMb/PilO family protein [Planctomycetota bacterium]